jgi:hypothetical protein
MIPYQTQSDSVRAVRLDEIEVLDLAALKLSTHRRPHLSSCASLSDAA